MMRKIIQIAASADEENGADLFALTNDGVVFILSNKGWKEMPPIPQLDPQSPESKLMDIEFYAQELMGGGDVEMSHEARRIGRELESMLSPKEGQ